MVETYSYYRRRLEEELLAAAQSEDPSISHIHLELARRYREMLGSDSDRANGSADVMLHSTGAIVPPSASFE